MLYSGPHKNHKALACTDVTLMRYVLPLRRLNC